MHRHMLSALQRALHMSPFLSMLIVHTRCGHMNTLTRADWAVGYQVANLLGVQYCKLSHYTIKYRHHIRPSTRSLALPLASCEHSPYVNLLHCPTVAKWLLSTFSRNRRSTLPPYTMQFHKYLRMIRIGIYSSPRKLGPLLEVAVDTASSLSS